MTAMTFQTWTVLLLAALAAGVILRGLFRSTSGKGCASGCGACPSKTCALRTLEAELKAAAKR